MSAEAKQGEVILFSDGDYSDYGYCGQVIFIKDCDIREQAEEHLLQLKEQLKAEEPGYKETPVHEIEEWETEFSHGCFVTWLVARGFCLPLECREIHLGSYGRIDL